MIEILLAAYNSEKYLREQIDSILEQDCDNWELLIRDGGSNDDSINIIKQYCSRYPDLINLLPSSGRSSAIENFSALLEASTAPYIMFADHDDVWFKDKVSKSFAKMKESEEIFGIDTPLLIFTDKHVVNENLQELSSSYFKYQKLDPSRITLNYLLTQNIPSGCTILVNRHLLNLAGKIPQTAVMHDHWLSLTAAALGKIVYLNEATLSYRQHEENIFGAKAYSWSYFYKKYKSGLTKIRKRFYLNVEQAGEFLLRYETMLSAEDCRMLEEFANLEEKKWLQRRKILCKYKIYKSGWGRNIGIIFII